MKLKILVVEDECVLAYELEFLLQSMGHDVVGVANTRADALEIASRTRPDLALVDLQLLDGMTGCDIASALEALYHTRIAFMTGHPISLRESDRSGRMVASKPYHDSAVAQIIRSVAETTAHDREL